MTDWPLPEGVHIKHPDKVFIGGRWIPATTGRSIDVISPNTEQVTARVAEGGEADMDLAVEAARQAFDFGPWPRMSVSERAAVLTRLADRLAEREPEIAKAWTAQIGALASGAPDMAQRGTAKIRTTTAVGLAHQYETIASSPFAPTALIVHEPVGVVAAIAPWNGPYPIMTGKISAALIAGCSVVMKPSPETPLEAYIIAEVAEEIGMPAGVLNLVTAHREASDHLVCNPGIDKVSFTGSTLAGRRIASVCGERMARCTLELGGKSAAIIRDDFETGPAAKILARTLTRLSGQVCVMLTRAIVPRARHDEMAEAIAKEMQTIRIGYSDDPQAQLAPVAMKRQLERIEGYIEKGKSEGADLVTGGKRPAHLNVGYFMELTLFANVDNKSTIAQEEIFGPVLSLIPCEDEEDAIRIANDSNYGLNGAVFTHDNDAAYRIARQMRSGNVGQNGLRVDANLPFGGFKYSGLGREGGDEGLRSYLETKTILLDGNPDHLA